MKVKFVGRRPREVAAGRRSITVHPGGEYDVPDALGQALCEQRWFEPVAEKKPVEKVSSKKEIAR
jgi:hypothetical protein